MQDPEALDVRWKALVGALAPRLAALDSREFVEIGIVRGGIHRHLIEFRAMPSGRLIRAELETGPFAVGIPVPEWKAKRRQIFDMGWRELTRKLQIVADSPRRRTDELVGLIARTLMDVGEVTDPMSLVVRDPLAQPNEEIVWPPAPSPAAPLSVATATEASPRPTDEPPTDDPPTDETLSITVCPPATDPASTSSPTSGTRRRHLRVVPDLPPDRR